MERKAHVGQVRFLGGAGAELAARVDLPEQGTPFRGTFLFAHSFGSSKDLRSTARIVAALTAGGFGVFRFDFTGAGQSGGDFGDTNFSTNIADVLAAAESLRSGGVMPLRGPDFLFGHSLGGAAMLAAVHHIPECRGVALLAAPSSTSHLRHLLLARAPELATQDEATVETIGKKVRVRRQMLEDFDRHDPLAGARAWTGPLLVFTSDVDQVTPPLHAQAIADAAGGPVSRVTVAGADHLLLEREADARFVGETLASWGRWILETRGHA